MTTWKKKALEHQKFMDTMSIRVKQLRETIKNLTVRTSSGSQGYDKRFTKLSS